MPPFSPFLRPIHQTLQLRVGFRGRLVVSFLGFQPFTPSHPKSRRNCIDSTPNSTQPNLLTQPLNLDTRSRSTRFGSVRFHSIPTLPSPPLHLTTLNPTPPHPLSHPLVVRQSSLHANLTYQSIFLLWFPISRLSTPFSLATLRTTPNTHPASLASTPFISFTSYIHLPFSSAAAYKTCCITRSIPLPSTRVLSFALSTSYLCPCSSFLCARRVFSVRFDLFARRYLTSCVSLCALFLLLRSPFGLFLFFSLSGCIST